MLEITIFATKIDFFRREKTSLSGTPISLPKIADLPISFQANITCMKRSSLIRVYTVCHSVCIVWTHYSMVEPHSPNFRVITTNFLGVRIYRKFTVFWYQGIQFTQICLFENWSRYDIAIFIADVRFNLNLENRVWCNEYNVTWATSRENLPSGCATR